MRKTLEYWENYYSQFFGDIKLIGEIPILRNDCDEMGTALSAIFKKHKVKPGAQIIFDQYYHAFACYMVGMGLHYYSDGGYWPEIEDATGIKQNEQGVLGELFEKICSKLDLEDFHALGGHRFVAPILAHGGIPSYSLTDFFEHIVIPYQDNPTYANTTTKTYLDEILQSSVIETIDRPILRFLQFGDDAAIKLLEKCLNLVKIQAQTNKIPSPKEADLPPYVINAFRQLIEFGVRKKDRRHAPKVIVDPYSSSFYLSLPQQHIDGNLVLNNIFFWKVTGYSDQQELVVHDMVLQVRRRGYDVLTEEKGFAIDEIATSLRICLCYIESESRSKNDLHILREWIMPLVPSGDETPIIVFDAVNGQMIKWNEYLPGKKLIIAIPKSSNISGSGSGYQYEEFDELDGAWKNWKLESWDLSSADYIQISFEDGKTLLPIPTRNFQSDPRLKGGSLLSSDLNENDVPLYHGALPSIHVPIWEGREVDREIKKWKLHIQSPYNAEPNLFDSWNLDDFAASIVKLENSFELPLTAVMGEGALGTYVISLTGPGFSKDYIIRVCPRVRVHNLEQFYLPDVSGAKPAAFLVFLPEDCELENASDTDDIHIKRSVGGFEVSVGPETTKAHLAITKKSQSLDSIRVPLNLAIPRLTWDFIDEGDQNEISMRGKQLQLPIEIVLQGKAPSLLLELEVTDELPFWLTVILQDGAANLLMESSKTYGIKYGQTRWRFNLGEFYDTLRQNITVATFEFLLRFYNTSNGHIDLIPLIQLNRDIEFSDAMIHEIESGKYVITWKENWTLENRKIWLFSEWMPWHKPLEFEVPDNNKGELEVLASLPPSRYKMKLVTDASGLEGPPDSPPADSLIIDTVSVETRINDLLTSLSTEPEEPFLYHFELASIYYSTGQIELGEQEATWCFKNLSAASPEQILFYSDFLEDKPTATGKAVRLMKYTPENVRRLIDRYKTFRAPIVQRYFSDFPTLSLIRPETAAFILGLDPDPQIAFKCMQTLVEKNKPEALDVMLNRITKGALSEKDAAYLLSFAPEFYIQQFAKLPESSLKSQLLKHLALEVPEKQICIFPEMWMRTDAGWGKIVAIVSPEGGNDIPYYFPDLDTPKLRVELRPNSFSEIIEIHLATSTIDFENSGELYICTNENCHHFITKNQALLTNRHNRAVHGGVQPSMRTISSTEISLIHPFEYSWEAPLSEVE